MGSNFSELPRKFVTREDSAFAMSSALKMEETWRWYGPNDPVSLADVKQAGATGVVTALHEVPIGEVWSVAAIRERLELIEASGLSWSVVESVPVHESIKTGTPEAERTRTLANYRETLRNLAACGIKRVAYNFMPVIDWTRTDLDFEWEDGSHALKFDLLDFAAFELYILRRPGAADAYDQPTRDAAKARHDAMDADRRRQLSDAVTGGLPGRTGESYTLEDFQAALDKYKDIGAAELRANLAHFIRDVAPVASANGIVLAIHPDDPPMPLLGLPRVVSTDDDVAFLLGCHDDVANGLCFCVGSYGSHPANDVEAMAAKYAERTHFVHLRNVRREDGSGSFVESDHLSGDVNMFSVVRTMMRERARRQAAGWDDSGIPFRPDHGHKMVDDLRGKKTNPGYTCIGRLRGLAEVRGLQEAIARVAEEAADDTDGSKRARH